MLWDMKLKMSTDDAVGVREDDFHIRCESNYTIQRNSQRLKSTQAALPNDQNNLYNL